MSDTCVEYNNFMNFVKNGRVKSGTWENKKNHKIYVDYLGKTLGFETMEDWYNINGKIIRENYGSGLLAGYYKDSPSLFVKSIFPEHEWLEWKFCSIPHYYWKDKQNHKTYTNWLGIELGYKNMEDWYNINGKIIRENHGISLLSHHYQDSPIRLLKSVYPKYNWIDWKFGHAPNGFWEDKENHKKYTDWLGIELGYKNIEDWYNISYDLIIKNHGCGLIKHYNDSPTLFVKEIFYQYEWFDWMFDQTSKTFWENKDNHRIYADWLGIELGYKNIEDWYKINVDLISNNYGGGLLSGHYYNTPSQFVKSIYPEYNWIEWKFTQTKRGFWKDINNHKNI